MRCVDLVLVPAFASLRSWLLHPRLYRRLARFLELQRQIEPVAHLQRLAQVDQHQVVALAVAQLHFLPCGQVDGGHLAHAHHIAFGGHLVQFHTLGHRRTGGHQSVRGGAPVADAAQVGRPVGRARQGRRGVRVVDDELARAEVVGVGGRGEAGALNLPLLDVPLSWSIMRPS